MNVRDARAQEDARGEKRVQTPGPGDGGRRAAGAELGVRC